MRRAAALALAAGAIAGVAGAGAGCGGDTDATAPPRRVVDPVPALARPPARAGEVVARGATTPAERGPYRLRGAYRVRFEQVAPEDPRLDFATQTPFVAALRPEAGGAGVPLVRAAARTGVRRVRVDGRFRLEVSFGDFPWALRLTPVR